MWQKVRSTLLMGILTSAPLALTVYVFILLFNWFDQLFQPIIQQTQWFNQPIPGLGILVGLIFIFIVGLLAPSLIGKQVLKLTERIVDRLPFAKLVYSGTKQIFDSFSKDSFSKFNRVVLIEFPRRGTYTLAFVTAQYSKSIVKGSQHTLACFVPTTPNPTSGYLIFVEESDVKDVKLSVDEALKIVISGGIVKPSIW